MWVQVNDSLAKQDAVALYHFLQHRGYIAEDPTHSLPALPAELPALKRHPSPLTGVDMIKVPITVVASGLLNARFFVL